MSQQKPIIIDCHGHYTTAPKALENWRNAQIAGIQDAALKPKVADLKISDDDLRETIEANQLKLMKLRGSDLTIFSPRASFMAHHIGDFEVSSTWAAICNELCYRVAQLFPDHFIPAAMLPQSPGVDPKTCIPELVKCVEQYGNVGINLNPDTACNFDCVYCQVDRTGTPRVREVDPKRTYNYEYVCFRVTEFRTDAFPDLMISGGELRHDLRLMVDHLDRSMPPLPIEKSPEPMVTLDEVSAFVQDHVK